MDHKFHWPKEGLKQEPLICYSSYLYLAFYKAQVVKGIRGNKYLYLTVQFQL